MTTRLVVRSGNCSGCRVCQLLCALVHFQENNVRKGAINVNGLFPSPGRYEVHVCDQCGDCAAACPEEAITFREGVWTIDPERCSGCGVCVDACPRGVMFTHPDLAAPFKCDACGECAAFCSREVLAVEKEEER